jgi:hypothetical protein
MRSQRRCGSGSMTEQNVATPETVQARQAALMLHGLAAHTRARVLAKLDAPQAQRLGPLLQELRDLGVAASLGERMHREATAGATEVEQPTVVERLARLNASAVLPILETCAPLTVARLLTSNSWPWHEQVVARLSRRDEVRRCMQASPSAWASMPAAMMQEQICVAAERHEPGGAPDAATPRRWRTRLAEVFAWTR